MSIERTFDLIINAGTSSPLIINANQNDSGEIWKFNLYQEDGTKVIPAAGEIVGLKTDGHAIVNAGTVNESGQVVITETAQMTAAPGANVFEIVFDSVHGTANFILYVEKSPVDDDADFSESDISAIQQAIAMAIDSATVQALQNKVSTETSERKAADALLQTEIDQIIAPSGEAPSAAEVENARIGADGIVYDTLGNAIRGQVSDLDQALETVEDALTLVETINLINPATVSQNTQLYPSGGTVARDDRSVTDYIPIEAGETYYFYANLQSNVFYPAELRILVFFDENKENPVAYYNKTSFTAETDGYIRFEFYNTQASSIEAAKSPQTYYSPWTPDSYKVVDAEARSDISQIKTEISKTNVEINDMKRDIGLMFGYERLILPEGFTGTYNPVAIYYNNKNVKSDFDSNEFMNGGTLVYCSPDGDPTVDGTDINRPTTLEHIRASVGGKKVMLSAGVHFISDRIGQENANCDIIGSTIGETYIVSGQNTNFTQSSDLWVATVSSLKTVYDIVLGLELFKVNTLNDLIDYSYVYDGTTLTVKTPFDPNGRLVTVQNTQKRVIQNYATRNNTSVFIKDVILIGGKDSVYNYGDGYNTNTVCDNVRALFSEKGVNATYATVLLNNSRFEHIYGDAISYDHAEYVEINSTGANCTDTTSHTTNGSTGHTHSKGIRAGGQYFNNEGANVADTNYCESVCVCCNGSYSCSKDRAEASNHATGFVCEDNSKMWLYNCVAVGNVIDLKRSGSTSVMYVKNCEYETESGITPIE